MIKNILFVTVGLTGGGAERVMVSLANQMEKKGYHVTFLLVVTGEVVYNLNSNIKIIKSYKRGHSFKQFILIRKELKKLNSGTVISFFTNMNILTILANIGLRNRIIVSERNDPNKNGKNKSILITRKYLFAYANKIVFQTKEASEYFPKSVQKKGIIIPNPIIENLPNRYIGEREKRIVTFARLTEQKNIPMLLDACKIIFNRYNDYTLDIYGIGELEEELIEHTKNLGIENKVNFCGFYSDVHHRILKAAIYVSTSDYEGISNSMLEAMAIGIPCICTDCPIGGARMFIKSYENGILIPVGDVNALILAMESVINSNELSNRLSTNASKIYDILSIENIFEKWNEFI